MCKFSRTFQGNHAVLVIDSLKKKFKKMRHQIVLQRMIHLTNEEALIVLCSVVEHAGSD